MQSNKNITVRELAQTIGTFVAAFTAVPLGQRFYRHLENSKVESLRRAYGDFDKKAFISTEAKTELKWWKENIKSSFAPIKVQPVHYAIYSDASLEGWGGTDGEVDIEGRWGENEEISHINSLELLAAFLCLKSFCKNKLGIHVLLRLDNSTAVTYINKKCGMVSKYCNDLAFDIWSWAVKKDIWLSASHVPGVENNIADLKSRYFYDNKEWSLNPYIIEKVCEKFGKPEIDLFATRLNAKCELYVSFKPNPNAFAVDAFTQNWNDIKGYAFPPLSLIGRILAKIKRDEASITVTVPCWQTQPWFPQFLRMVEHDTAPVLLKPHHKLLQVPGTGQKHLLWKKLHLIVARFPGVSKWKDYRQVSVRSSWHHGDQIRRESTTEQCKDGWNIAEDGSIIPNIQL